MIDYSVIIRTTGKAHTKYQALLDSIRGLEPQPKEVIVVLPEGYALPDERLGWETFCFSPKGMVIQRMEGIARCTTRYGLVCDDDVRFGPDFVQKLYEPVRQGLCSFSAGPLYSFLPQRGIKALASVIMGGAVPTILHKKDRYVTVLRSAGYSYNRHLERQKATYFESQSVAWTCFFADIHALRELEFEKEVWLDSHGYAAMDDQTMFYKGWLMGHRTLVVSDAYYEHLDGKTSTRNNSDSFNYSLTYNMVVFWHRFLYSMERTAWGRLCTRAAFSYRMLFFFLWQYSFLLRKRMTTRDMDLIKRGYRDGWAYVRSDAYRQLPPIKRDRA